MALTPAEKQQKYRERLKIAARLTASSTDALPGPSFEEFLRSTDDGGPPSGGWNHTWNDLRVTLAYVDIDIAHLLSTELEWDVAERNTRGMIGRAEWMAGALITGGVVLSELINRYKLEKVARAIAEIEQADLSDPKVRDKALNDLVTLKAIETKLNKRTGVKGLHAIY